jgi:microcystin-dependent protein
MPKFERSAVLPRKSTPGSPLKGEVFVEGTDLKFATDEAVPVVKTVGQGTGGGGSTLTYTSPDQTISQNGSLTLAHGLGIKPVLVTLILKCTSADANYSPGDEVFASPLASDASTGYGIAIRADSTNLYIKFPNSNSFGVPDLSTGATTTINIAKWSLVVRAWGPIGGGGTGSGDTLEAGTVIPYAGLNAPTGWLMCDGSAVSRSTYATLFSAIGTTYGSGDGSTTFNLPDLRGRVVVGKGQGSGLTNRVLAATGGEESHILTVAELPSHTHQLSNLGYQAGGITNPKSLMPASQTSNAVLQVSDATGSGQAHENMPPFVVLNYIIKHTPVGATGGGGGGISVVKKSKNASIGGVLTSILPAVPSGKSFRINKLIVVNDTTSAATFDLELNDGTNGAVLLEDDYTLGPRGKIEYENIFIPNNGTAGTIRMSSTQTLNAFINYDEGSSANLKGVAITFGTSLTTIIPPVAAGKIVRIPRLYIHNPTTADNNFNLKLLDAAGGLELELADGYIFGPKTTIIFENLSIAEGGYLKAIMPSLTGVAICGYEEVSV